MAHVKCSISQDYWLKEDLILAEKLELSRSAEPLLTIARNKVKQNIDMDDDISPIQPDSTPLRNIVDREARSKLHTVSRKQI